MKKAVLCFAVLLLLLSGCSLSKPAAYESTDAALPTLSEIELHTHEAPEVITRPQATEDAERPTLHRTEPETHGSAQSALVAAAEVVGTGRKPKLGDAQTFALGAEAVSFGKTNPLVFSAEAKDDESVTVSFPSGNCYVKNGKLLHQTDSLVLSFGETVYIEVREGDSTGYYALYLTDSN